MSKTRKPRRTRRTKKTVETTPVETTPVETTTTRKRRTRKKTTTTRTRRTKKKTTTPVETTPVETTPVKTTTTRKRRAQVKRTTKRPQRSFKVRENGTNTARGRYLGSSPYQAANKALTELIRQRTREGKVVSGKIHFTLIESTRNSKHKEHNYEGERRKLDTPVSYPVGKGKNKKEIVKRFRNYLRKVRVNQSS